MPLRLQPKLLHILQTKLVERLGGIKSIPVNTRVLSCTNRNLERMIAEKEFRSDLFFRLNVIPIHIPPLRVRSKDMLLLLDKFLEKFCRNEGKVINGVSDDVKELFISYEEFPWFKNVTVGKMLNVEEPTPCHFYWPDLDVDLDIESVEHPERFPLKSKYRISR